MTVAVKRFSVEAAKGVASVSGGTSVAAFARFNVVDLDGDVTIPGAFGAQVVPVVPAHEQTHVPLGKATIREAGDLALAEIEWNGEIQAAREWLSAITFDLQNPPPRMEYSYGYIVRKSRPSTVNGRSVRILEQLEVLEVSPVLKGAGIRTHTVSAGPGSRRSGAGPDVPADVADVAARLSLSALRARVTTS